MPNHLKLINLLEIIPNGDVVEIYKISTDFLSPKYMLSLKLQRKRKSSQGYSLHSIINTVDYDIFTNNNIDVYSKVYYYVFLNNIHQIIISEEEECNIKCICIDK